MTEVAGRRLPGTPCWATLMVHRADQARSFYGALFGWEFEHDPGRRGAYTSALLDGRRVAAIGDGPAEPLRPVAWTTMFASDDVDGTAELVRACGGTVAVGPLNAEGEGRLAIAADPSGAVFGIRQGERSARAEPTGGPGSVAWSELRTWESPLVAKFYQVVFGSGAEPSAGEEPDRVVLTVGGRAVAGVHGLGSRLPRDRGAHWTTFFETVDVDETVHRAAGLGGRVVDPPYDSPCGRAATLVGPEGAAFALLAPAPA
ncbi:VOC family protein [Streptomyces sp. HPF1205]|uniref:VOC family protein n=1 Tax=Streptomyces sp. HPF1205 TaxID=2873262 RepID=UPI001CEE00CC|nr:VOC family protein [Streptomyces sp. HPF1205]